MTWEQVSASITPEVVIAGLVIAACPLFAVLMSDWVLQFFTGLSRARKRDDS